MSFLKIEKCWHDTVEDFCQLNILAGSDCCKVKSNYYVSDDIIEIWSEEIKKFAEYKQKLLNIGCYDCDEKTLPYFQMKAEYIDMAGHIRIEIYMDIDDRRFEVKSVTVNHHCCFYLYDIEPNELILFSNQLKHLQDNQFAELGEEKDFIL